MTQCIEDKLELIYDTDSYKKTHEPAYPEGLEYVQSYLEARKYEFPIGDELNGEKPIVIFGLQYILEKFFIGQVITKEIIDEAEKFDALHFGQYTFNKKGWMEILTEHGGKLPIKICSVREGTVMGVRQVILTIENTDPKCGWLVNYLETMLMRLWYPITVATKSYLVKQKILKYLKLSGTPESIDFKVQDFGSRGTETRESAKIGGASHLVNFKGSDTVIAILMLKQFYDCDMAGFSIPATEHSVMCSKGREGESGVARRFLEYYKDRPLRAMVIDSYDYRNFCDQIMGVKLYDLIMSSNGTTIARPDSVPKGSSPEAVMIEILEILGKRFGWSYNNKNYKVLNFKVRTLWGDGLDLDGVEAILSTMEKAKWSIDNIAFGMGGALLQKLNRDTLGMAIKACWMQINGIGYEIFKDPVGDTGKASKRGKQDSYNLEIVFLNGEMMRHQTLDEIRQRIISN